jgi:hypothetical protein
MFEFFKNKKAGKAIKNILSGCFVFVFIAIAAYGLIVPQTAHAQTLSQIGQIVGFLSDPVDAAGGALASTFVAIYVGFSIPVAAFLLWGSAELLEMAIKYSVLELRWYIGPDSAVAETWKVLRDFGNMFFIFILLYTAIMTILGMGSGDVKKVVVKVIIMAVLINFSFFFTKVAIDASNIVSIAFYKQIVNTRCGDVSVGPLPDVNIGGAFMCSFGLTKLFSTEIITDMGKYFVNGLAGSAALLRYATFGSALMVMLAIILFAGCILFLYRFVAILLLLAFSPLAFAAMAFPSDKYSGRWTKPLMEVCISAPVFMLFTWVTLRLARSLASGQNGSIVDVISSKAFMDSASNPGLLTQHIQASINFFVIAAMMVATLIISKEVGAAGAGWGLKAMNNFSGWAKGVVGRNTIGRVSKLADKGLEKIAPEFSRSFIGQEFRNLTTKAGVKAKFGSKESFESVEKSVKKSQKEHLESVEKDMEGKIGEKIMTLRDKYITEQTGIKENIELYERLNKEIVNDENAVKGLNENIQALEAQERIEGSLSDENKNKLEEHKLEKERISERLTQNKSAQENIRKGAVAEYAQTSDNKKDEFKKKIQTEIDTTKANKAEDIKFTKDEKKGFARSAEISRFMKGTETIEGERMAALKKLDTQLDNSKKTWRKVARQVLPFGLYVSGIMKEDRENRKKELTKKLLGIGKKDVKRMIRDLQREVVGEEEGGEGKEGGGEGAEKKPGEGGAEKK